MPAGEQTECLDDFIGGFEQLFDRRLRKDGAGFYREPVQKGFPAPTALACLCESARRQVAVDEPGGGVPRSKSVPGPFVTGL